MLQSFYLILCILGFVLPYSQFVPFLLEHGLDIKLFFEQLFANRISGFFGMDVAVSSLVLWTFVFWGSKKSDKIGIRLVLKIRDTQRYPQLKPVQFCPVLV